jgi:hypothetical protein
MNIFLFLLIYIPLITTLYIKHQSPLTYLNTLKFQQQSLNTLIQNIKTSITQNQQTIQNTPDIQQKITIL